MITLASFSWNVRMIQNIKINNVIYHINRDKDYKIISKEAAKASDKIQHRDANLDENRYKRTLLQFGNSHLWQIHSQHHAKWGKYWGVVLLNPRTRLGRPLSLLLFNIVLKTSARVIRQEKELKEIQIGKEEKSNYLYLQMIWPFTQKTPQKRLPDDS